MAFYHFDEPPSAPSAPASVWQVRLNFPARRLSMTFRGQLSRHPHFDLVCRISALWLFTGIHSPTYGRNQMLLHLPN